MKNNGLSAEEKRVIYAAMEMLERRDFSYCCYAINAASGNWWFDDCLLTEEFDEFYGRNTGGSWSEVDFEFGAYTGLDREWRQFLLAWFAEVGPRGIE